MKQGHQTIQAFVLKKKALLKDDYLVSFFSRESGKVTAFAKGARTFSSRRAAHLQTGNLVTAQLHQYHDAWYIQSTDLVSAFSRVKTDVKLEALYLFLFAIDHLSPEDHIDAELYTVILNFMCSLSSTDNSLHLLSTSLHQVVSSLGYIDSPVPFQQLLNTIESIIDTKLPYRAIM